MRPTPITLRFGDREFTVAPFRLGEIRELESKIQALSSATGVAGAIEIVGYTLRRIEPQIDVEQLEMPENGATGLVAMMTNVLAYAGFRTGNVQAPEATASGATSTEG